MPIVEFNSVSYVKDGQDILADVTFSLGQNRVGIVGQNGSGKTSLLRLMSGLVAPTGGAILIDGIDPAVDRKAAIEKIGVLFQNPDHQIIFPTVEEEIAFGLKERGLSPHVVVEKTQGILARFGKAHWAEKSCQTLSGGQRHLLCLMAVLVLEPEVIILDEPYAGLDIPTRLFLQRIFETLPQQIIHVTHELDNVTGYDRVIWIADGTVRQDGPADVVLADYAAEMAVLGARDAFA
ncbi:MAG: energy-coupling factor ABC transporter ATP-binding protein [Halocynthiibacter sp.]